ncbi:efflux RND transporter periplasmic adaptor subunit [Thiohalomonas denitrificans]|uniref:HlyD family secretion protein n=1 Tax=Thiohalomonas denitrificans TaxID=415747 RepID=A0A1G5PT20_9GAMM|nr:efflux RND transporter periplasmic adaptor subunit [Thiohalomonas denitrificans]SCZ52714.1 HlyD family secretion protein [Thiohalomonas denitrificans]
MSFRKKIGLLLLAAAIVGLLLFAFRPTPVVVSAAEVIRAPLRVTLEYEGRTRVKDRFVIGAPANGYAPRLMLEEGDAVSAGEVLLRLRPQPPVLLDPRNLQQAQAAVEEARSAHEFARSELARIRKLFERGDVSESQFNEAESIAAQARARLSAALAAASRPDSDATDEVPLIAPADGNVLEIAHKSAGAVAPGEPILTIGNPERLEAAIDVLSSDAVRLSPGMPVLFERWGGGIDLEGEVRTVEPAAFTEVSALGVEEQRVWVIADITSPRNQWQQLGDGYRVEARFILWQGDDVLQAPASAVFRRGEAWAAFVMAEGRAQLRQVEVGRRGELAVQILDGLSAGEQVITHPDSDIEDGTRVAMRE